ncbi:hypothetical protein BGZ60DRAFT_399703 [Tricladium varicosporioides]|nr:hypothetical protein BGZ60DRAFT_399703 [Hymenoscyphus varicosporioides]
MRHASMNKVCCGGARRCPWWIVSCSSYAVLCYAMLCYAVLCYAVLRCDVLELRSRFLGVVVLKSGSGRALRTLGCDENDVRMCRGCVARWLGQLRSCWRACGCAISCVDMKGIRAKGSLLGVCLLTEMREC